MALLLAACAPAAVGPVKGERAVSDKPIMTWPDLLTRAKPAADATLSYGKDALQVVDVWVPKGKGPHPAVIMIHGGCWQTAVAERDIMNWIADDLRAHGVGVWNIEYRGVDRGGGYPGTYQDVGAAADLFLREGAAQGFAMDTPRIAIGHSAGGHLARWLARRPGLAADDALRSADPVTIDVAISQGGLPDLRAGAASIGHACGAEAPRDMARGEYARTSPPEMPLGDAREMQFNNALDRVTPPAIGEAYRAAMAKRGRTVTMEVTPGEGHVELIAPDSVSWSKQRAAILAALGMETK